MRVVRARIRVRVRARVRVRVWGEVGRVRGVRVRVRARMLGLRLRGFVRIYDFRVSFSVKVEFKG